MADILSPLIRRSFPFLLGFGILCLLINYFLRVKSEGLRDLGQVSLVFAVGAGFICLEHEIRERLAKRRAVKLAKSAE